MTVEVAIGSRGPSRMIPVVAPVCSPQPEDIDAVRALDHAAGRMELCMEGTVRCDWSPRRCG